MLLTFSKREKNYENNNICRSPVIRLQFAIVVFGSFGQCRWLYVNFASATEARRQLNQTEFIGRVLDR